MFFRTVSRVTHVALLCCLFGVLIGPGAGVAQEPQTLYHLSFDDDVISPINPQFDTQDLVLAFRPAADGASGSAMEHVRDGDGLPLLGGFLRLTAGDGWDPNDPRPIAVSLNLSAAASELGFDVLRLEQSREPMQIRAYSRRDGKGQLVDTLQIDGVAVAPYNANDVQSIRWQLPQPALSFVIAAREPDVNLLDELDVSFVLPDFVTTAIEVTQTIQDVKNSVRLVANKRTFVRLHCEARAPAVAPAAWTRWTTARLVLTKGNSIAQLQPINGVAGVLPVPENPNRHSRDHAFLFEIPDGFRDGSVSIDAHLNPEPRSPLERTYANNELSTEVSFEEVPAIDLVLYRVTWYRKDTLMSQVAPQADADQLVNWLERAYPVHEVRVWHRTMSWGSPIPGLAGPPLCTDINSALMSKKAWDSFEYFHGLSEVPLDAHYYGMVFEGDRDDDGDGVADDFMRGCSLVPSITASGPTGPGTWDWDFDGSYGDWYGGHELAHTYNREHAPFCGTTFGDPYPYPNGEISPVEGGDDELRGFDPGLGGDAFEIVPPTWHDLMTYCDEKWLSDFTFEALMDHFQTSVPSTKSTRPMAGGSAKVARRFLIAASIEPDSGTVRWKPVFTIPDDGQPRRSTAGAYAIVLRDADDTELLRHAFEPLTPAFGASPHGAAEPDRSLIVHETVPAEPRTATIELVGPDGVLYAVSSGSREPTIEVTRPSAGETLDGQFVTVSWTADDPDGDPLAYSIRYSLDGGRRWETYAVYLEQNSVEIDRRDLTGGTEVIFRVYATDGLNTVAADSATISVTDDKPVVRIMRPVDDRVSVFAGQTVHLRARFAELRSEPTRRSAMRWYSDLDGPLGQGRSVSLASLSPGEHTITVEARVRGGETVTDTTRISIAASADDLEEPQSRLIVEPTRLKINLETGDRARRVDVGEPRLAPVGTSWRVETSVEWLRASASEGTTPDGFRLGVAQDFELAPGEYEATAIVTSPEDPDELHTIQVRVVVPASRETVFKRGDANDDGKLNIADPMFVLAFLFAGTDAPTCTDTADANDDGQVNIADPVSVLDWLFGQGAPPPPPSQSCGQDPTPDELGSCSFSSC